LSSKNIYIHSKNGIKLTPYKTTTLIGNGSYDRCAPQLTFNKTTSLTANDDIKLTSKSLVSAGSDFSAQIMNIDTVKPPEFYATKHSLHQSFVERTKKYKINHEIYESWVKRSIFDLDELNINYNSGLELSTGIYFCSPHFTRRTTINCLSPNASILFDVDFNEKIKNSSQIKLSSIRKTINKYESNKKSVVDSIFNNGITFISEPMKKPMIHFVRKYSNKPVPIYNVNNYKITYVHNKFTENCNRISMLNPLTKTIIGCGVNVLSTVICGVPSGVGMAGVQASLTSAVSYGITNVMEKRKVIGSADFKGILRSGLSGSVSFGISGGESTMTSNFSKNMITSGNIKNSIVNTISGEIASEIKITQDDDLPHKILHGVNGAVTGQLLNKDPLSGVIGSVSGEYIGEFARDNGISRNYGIPMAQVGSAVFSNIVGCNPKMSSHTAEIATRNNAYKSSRGTKCTMEDIISADAASHAIEDIGGPFTGGNAAQAFINGFRDIKWDCASGEIVGPWMEK